MIERVLLMDNYVLITARSVLSLMLLHKVLQLLSEDIWLLI